VSLYRIACPACEFSCCTDSAVEARKVRQFHENWNSDIRGPTGLRTHLPRITASAYAVRTGRQIALEELVEALA